MDHVHEFTVEKMCSVLGVSKSGYYKWRQHRVNQRMQETKLADFIRYEYEHSRCTYGSPRIAQQLNEQVYVCSKSTVARFMKRMNIAARCKRRFIVTTDSKHGYRVFDNLLNRQFEVDQPGQYGSATLPISEYQTTGCT